jgi:hypothetical protein
MTTQTLNRLPWQFFVGPDGVVRTTDGSSLAATRAALHRHGLTDLLGK